MPGVAGQPSRSQQSYAAAALAFIVVVPLVARILVEEAFLHKTLSGYTEYTARVPYRVIPFLW